jgi:spermidine synthase
MKPLPSESNRTLWLVAGCFFLSGFAALVYETVWLRQFAILLGTSQEALAIVLSSYMGGLALGSLLAGRFAYRTQRPVLLYAILELGIAVAALLIPYGLQLARVVQAILFGATDRLPSSGDWGQSLFDLATCWTLILIPTAMMGATLPLLSRMVVSKNEQIGPRIGLLYGINTLGAVFGTLAAAFWYLPTLGLGRTTWVAASANVFVFLVVVVLARWGAFGEKMGDTSSELGLPKESTATIPTRVKPASGKERRRKKQHQPVASSVPPESLSETRFRLIALFIGFSGAVSFAYEIVFTRMLGHFLGGSVFAFSTMLAGFLLGIAIGGLVASRLAIDRYRSAVFFIYCQLLISLSAIIAFRWINNLAGIPPESWFNLSITGQQVVASVLTLLPTSVFIGATFPFAIRVYAKDESQAATGSAWTYACNTIGGIMGAMFTGAIALPILGYEGTVLAASLVNVALAAATFYAFRPQSMHAIAIAFSLLLLVLWRPVWPENVARVSALSGTLTSGPVVFDHVGQSSTVTAFYDHGSIRFQTNGLPEAIVPPAGAGIDYLSYSACLGALAPLIRPGCEEMLMIGLGGGGSVASIPPSVKRIDVVEIESAVVSANQSIAHHRDRDPLSDPRVNIVINDARNALSLTTKKYDAIVSQPSHPWTAGASHLYTRQFAQIVRNRLKPKGVFIQWMNAEFIDDELLQSIGATLLGVFPQVRLYQPFRGELLFVGSDESMQPEAVMIDGGDQGYVCLMDERDKQFYRRIGIVTPTHLFAWLLLDHRGVELMSQGVKPVTDERNILAMKAPRLRRGHDPRTVVNFAQTFSPLARSWKEARTLCPTLELGSYSQYLIHRHRSEYVRHVVIPIIEDPSLKRVLNAEQEIRLTSANDNLHSLLEELASPKPDSRICFMLLMQRLAMDPGDTRISTEAHDKCLAALSPNHSEVYEIMRDWAAGKPEAVAAKDSILARLAVDDVTFRWATIARLAWRISSNDPDPARQQILADEAIDIADDAAPFITPLTLSWFRTLAAVKAKKPEVALSTADFFANYILLLHESKRETSSFAKTLAQCLTAIHESDIANQVSPSRYNEVITKINNTLAITVNNR